MMLDIVFLLDKDFTVSLSLLVGQFLVLMVDLAKSQVEALTFWIAEL